MVDRQNRKGSSISGGLIVVAVGVVFLIANLHPELDLWSVAMRYWPVILIVVGLGKIADAFLIRNDGTGSYASRNAGVSVAMLVLIVLVVLAITRGHGRVVIQQESQTIELQAAKTVTANINLPSGTLDLAGGASKLLDADFKYRERDGKPMANYTVSNGQGTLDISQENDSHVHFAGSGNDWRLRLANGVPLEMNIDIGAGKAEVNLQGLDVSHADLKVGAGHLNLDLTGQRKSDLHVDIHGGVGTAVIRLPKDIGVRVHASDGLGGVSAHGFHEDGDDYTNDAVSKSPTTIYVTISGGIGHITLEQ
jgi:uncharacterized protein DUF2154/cell wall-active antibiotic response 4TMS protein YvqF